MGGPVVRVHAEAGQEQHAEEHERLESKPIARRRELRGFVDREVDTPWHRGGSLRRHHEVPAIGGYRRRKAVRCGHGEASERVVRGHDADLERRRRANRYAGEIMTDRHHDDRHRR